MIITAKTRFIKGSSRKLRLIANSLRKVAPLRAIEQLKLLPQRGAKTLLKVFQQAIGNAKSNFRISPQNLQIASLQVQDGPHFKRRDAHAHGARFDSGIKHKKFSHVILDLKTTDGS